MIEKYFTPGQKIELHSKANAEGKKKMYVSQVNQILSEDKIEILMPIVQSKIVLLPQNAKYTMIIYTDSGLFECMIKVVDRYKNGNLYVHAIQLESAIKKHQRREFYRCDCSIPVLTRKLEDIEKETLTWNEYIRGKEGTALDISGGGLRFVTEQDYEAGEYIVCALKLTLKKERKEVQVLGKVLRTGIAESLGKKEVRVEFQNITDDKREQIMTFISEEQRKTRKKDSWR